MDTKKTKEIFILHGKFRPVENGPKATSHSMVFDNPMHPVREDKGNDEVLPVEDGPQFP